ncbi:MAG TPA: serine hydroxymethyltransferase, partial [Planctomycetota bacterium]|nr:serine hydroxymethyltransferase [Planctomycetota bacterium]
DRVRDVERIVRENDDWRLHRTINLIASENVLSARARALLPSDFGHRYAEGHPEKGKRYYQGTKHIDVIEARTREAMKQLFGVQHAEVRTVSGTNANDVVFSAFVKPDDKVIVNSLEVGGHISHQPIGGMGKYTRNILRWPRDPKNGYAIDVAASKDLLAKEKPKMVVIGKSLIMLPEPAREIAAVCKELGVLCVFDGAHVLGLIAGKQFQDPIAEGCDILLGSTHKTFFGPQRGVVLSNTLPEEKWKRVDKLAFPGCLSNHHLFTLPPLLVAATEMIEFGRDYARQVVANAKAFAKALAAAGFDVQLADYGYTESHQVAVDVKKQGGGRDCAQLLEDNDIICNYNLLPHDDPKAVMKPSGLRLGVQEMTHWGMKEPEMEQIARFFKECLIDRKTVKDEVNRFRSRFVRVAYSFDQPAAGPEDAPTRRVSRAGGGGVEMDLAGY